MTLSIDTLEAALVAVNRQRGQRRRDIADVAAGRRDDLPGRLEADLARLTVVFDDLAAELARVKAAERGPTVESAQAEVDDAVARHAALIAAADEAFG